jgi:hypothetical protein
MKNSNWTEEEDRIITEKGKSCRNKKDWRILSNYLKKDTDKCIRRFKVKNPLIKKGKWTKEEDQKLLDLMDIFGKNWTLISRLFTSRNPKQVKNRFENTLNPSLIKKKFSKEDDELIKKLYDLFGNKWSMYLNYFPYCSIKRIKTRFMRIYITKKEKNRINYNNKNKNINNIKNIKNTKLEKNKKNIDINDNDNFNCNDNEYENKKEN